MMTIAVTGATGGIGSRVAARLAARGAPPRLVVRDRAGAPEIPGAEVRACGGYADAAGMRAALDGVHTLFLVSGKQARDRLAQHISAVEAAAAAGVRRIVYLSFLAAAADATFTYARDHFHTEQHIKATGLPHTFLRPSLYLDRLPGWASAGGAIRGPAGTGRCAWVARNDVADVAAAILPGDGHDGRTYDVTGPEAMTLAEAAERIARAAGRPISYIEETLEEARESRRPTGAPDWEIEGWVTSYAAIATGEMDVVSDAVATIAGHPPQGLDAFLAAHPEALEHLTGWRARPDPL